MKRILLIFTVLMASFYLVACTNDTTLADLQGAFDQMGTVAAIPTEVTSDFNVPTEVINDVTVEWSSSDTNVISFGTPNEGVVTASVTRPASDDANAEVVLTATLTLSDVDPLTYTVTVTVLAEESSSLLNEATLQSLTSQEAAVYMGNGINLGNTMEAWGHSELGTEADITDYETFWGQPITTPEMIEGMKAEGFDTLRIPVAWTNMMDYESKDYTIDQALLTRVTEIVNYALDADMFVIVNDHWDGGWWGMFGSETASVRQDAMDLYTSMWTQIGNHFKDYSYKLILESANEELGDRLNDDDIAEDSGYLDTRDQLYAKTNEINQAFVDTIRATGGKNVDRFLLIAGYNTDVTMTYDDRFQMPTDTVDDKLFLSVHYYTPWNYCGTSGIAVWGSETQYVEQNTLLEMMTKYTDQGYAIVIGEWGVFPQSDGNLKENTDEFFDNFLNNCDLYGYVPVLWDTNSFYSKEDRALNFDLLSSIFTSRDYESQSELTQEVVASNATTAIADAIVMAHQRDEEGGVSIEIGASYAWLMYTDADWANTYSVGDTYDPVNKTVGIEATDVQVEEAGTYTIGLDFTNTQAGYVIGVGFAAIGISFGEDNFPGYYINVTTILINGEVYTTTQNLYTSSDDEHCTRSNLYNPWVSQPITEGRSNQVPLEFTTAQLFDPDTLGDEENRIYTIEITFDYVAPAS